MAWSDWMESTVAQTREPPMVTLDEVKDHAAAVHRVTCWDRFGVFFDDEPQALVTVLLDGEEVVAALRFCLPADESVEALRAYCGLQGTTELRCWQGHMLTHEQLMELSDLSGVWVESVSQSAWLTAKEWKRSLVVSRKRLGRRVGARRSVKTHEPWATCTAGESRTTLGCRFFACDLPARERHWGRAARKATVP